jgi:hypothetical protein
VLLRMIMMVVMRIMMRMMMRMMLLIVVMVVVAVVAVVVVVVVVVVVSTRGRISYVIVVITKVAPLLHPPHLSLSQYFLSFLFLKF